MRKEFVRLFVVFQVKNFQLKSSTLVPVQSADVEKMVVAGVH